MQRHCIGICVDVSVHHHCCSSLVEEIKKDFLKVIFMKDLLRINPAWEVVYFSHLFWHFFNILDSRFERFRPTFVEKCFG